LGVAAYGFVNSRVSLVVVKPLSATLHDVTHADVTGS
jgi:hypothetical protein